MIVNGKTDRGKRRNNNEDAFRINKEIGLLIVADGIGGHQAGEVASNLAVEEIETHIKEHLEKKQVPEVLYDAIIQSNHVVYTRAIEDEALSGMGTTIVVALCDKNKIHLAHVGDSRAYHITRTDMIQLTEDHSVVAELVRMGEITPEDARNHPKRGIITRSIGNRPEVEPEINTFSWEEGDYLLLCTDGLTDMVEDEKIEMIVTGEKQELETISQELVESANLNGGYDNITLILAYNE